jgi:hypothetical protein
MDKNNFSESEDTNGRKAARDVQDRAAAELTKIKRAGTNVRAEVETYVREQPLAAVGIALGAGFVLGGIFGSKLGRFALVAAVTYVAQDLVEGALGEGGVRGLLLDEVSKLGNAKRKASS